MKCPMCEAEMDFDEECGISFDGEDTIIVKETYHCDNCDKSFKFFEKFKEVSSEFICEVGD